MSKFILWVLIFLTSGFLNASPKYSLYKAFDHKFLVGVALSDNVITRQSHTHSMIRNHFNSAVAENCMKSVSIQPKEGVFDFEQADRFVGFAESNNMFIVGHSLVWHSQTPDWLFVGENGKTATRSVLIERMRNHIHTLVERYKGRVDAWDVVNEAITGDGEFRKTPWYEIIGEDYIEMAFRFANEADPEAQLYYNDFGMDNPRKRKAVVAFVKKLKQKGIRIDGIGMQGHYSLNLSLKNFEESIIAFGQTGLGVHITELDVTGVPQVSDNQGADINLKHESNPKLNPYPNQLPDSVRHKFDSVYKEIFKVLLKHNDAVKRVTFWGLNDTESWRNNWPVKGRIDYPLLFDRNNKPKSVVDELIRLVE